jgi:signal transduction histidine kinase
MTSATQPPLVALVVAAAAVASVTIGVEWWGFRDGDDAILTVADGAVAVVLMSCAIVMITRRRTRRLGLIIGLAGATWLAGAVYASAVYLHRGPLAHLHLSYPTGRLRRRPAAVAVIAAYAGGMWAGQTDRATLLISTVTVVVATAAHRRSSGIARRAALPALLAAWMLAGVLGLAAANRLGTWQVDRALLWAYYVVVATGVVVLVVDTTTARWANAAATDLVIDLGGASSPTLQDALARAVDDETLVVGYWDPRRRQYLNEGGEVVDTRDPGPNRTTTTITDHDEPLAVIVHDATALDDAGLVNAVAAATRLSRANERLRSEAVERVTSLADSRRRIVEAGDTQRQRLERDLRDRVRAPLEQIGTLLHSIQERSPAPILGELQLELAQACRELDDFGRGLHPRILTEQGLKAAISSLHASAPLAIEVSLGELELPQATATTVYYVCTEALANVAKHAHASNVWIDIAVLDDRVVATIVDDGIGGADASEGSGLRGLMDRVESVEGRLTVSARPGGGTRVEASIPTTRLPAAHIHQPPSAGSEPAQNSDRALIRSE